MLRNTLKMQQNATKHENTQMPQIAAKYTKYTKNAAKHFKEEALEAEMRKDLDLFNYLFASLATALYAETNNGAGPIR